MTDPNTDSLPHCTDCGKPLHPQSTTGLCKACQGEPLPTPDEIAARTAEIRRGWSQRETRKRAGTEKQPQPWTVPEVKGPRVEQEE